MGPLSGLYPGPAGDLKRSPDPLPTHAPPPPPPTTNPGSTPEYTTTNSYHIEIEYHYDQFVPYRNRLHYDQFVSYRNRLHYDQFVTIWKYIHYVDFVPYGSRYIVTNSLRCEFVQLVTNIYQDC